MAGVIFGATKRGQTKHLLVRGEAICGQVDRDQLDDEGSMVEGPWGARVIRGGVYVAGGRIEHLGVCSRCCLEAAALHAACTDEG